MTNATSLDHRAHIEWARPRVLLIEYAGDIPADAQHVREVERILSAGPPTFAVGFELEHLRSFHHAQVALHGSMMARLASRMRGVALIKPPPAARFGAVTVSLMSKVPSQSFDARDQAMTWLESRAPSAPPRA